MPTLQYDIAVVGVGNVERAMASIEKRFVDHNRRMATAVARSTSSTAIKSAAARTTGPKRAKDEPAGIARGFSEIAKASKLQAEEAKRASKENRGLADSFTQLARAGEKAERAQIRAGEASKRASQRSFESRALVEKRAAEEARRTFRRRTGAVVDTVGGSLSSLANAGMAVSGLGGGALIASNLAASVGLEKSQRALVTAGHGAGEHGAFTYEDVRNKVSTTAIQTGASQSDVTAGMREYVSATGNLQEASDSIVAFATIAQAAEASVSDVAKAGAYLSKSMGITAKEMPEALAKLYFQGKKGAFELKDIASAVPALGSQAATLGMHGMGGITTLGGLAQIAQTGTGNAAEAQTALSNLFTQIVAKSDKLQSGEAFGGRRVSVFEKNDPKNKMNDIRVILADMIAGSRGNVQELEKFGEIRGSRALNPMVNAYKDAADATKGTDKEKVAAGRAAVLKMIQENADANGTFKDVQKDLGEVLQSTSVQLEILNTKLESVVQSTLLPEMVKLAPHIIALVPSFAKLVESTAKVVEFLANNPFTGIGAIIAAKVTADLAMAGIGAGVRAAITALISSGAAGSALSATAGAIAGGANAAAGAAGLGAAGAGTLALGATGAVAAGAVGAAGYNAYELYKENEASGGVWQNVKNSFDAPAHASSPEQYDQMVAVYKEQLAAARKQNDAAVAMQAAAKSLQESRAPNRGNSPSPIK